MKFEFKFPDVGEGIHEGTIVEWLVEKGERVEEGDSLVEVETDKVTTDIPSPKSGKVLELLGDQGETIHVGNVFVVLDIEGHPSSDDGEEKEEEEEETAGVVGEVLVSSDEIAPSYEATSEKKAKEEKTKLINKVYPSKFIKYLPDDLSLQLKYELYFDEEGLIDLCENNQPKLIDESVIKNWDEKI